MATTPHAGAHTESRFDRKIKSYSHRKRHYTFAKMTPRSKQNQWLISREPARSVEDGPDVAAKHYRIRNWHLTLPSAETVGYRCTVADRVDLHIVIADGGSTDQTRSIVQR